MNLNHNYQYQLKTGEIVRFKTNMTKEEINKLPPIANQYKFTKYFRDKGKQLEIYQIIKNH